MKRLHQLLFMGCLTLSSTQLALAEQTIIVLDASGSMWGQIDGKPKLQIARDALSTVLAGVPADMELGLIAYGHRQKGSCSDIELVVKPAAGTAPAITQAAADMRFLGKTPLSAAVKQAAEVLKYTEEKATVILITDGLENCNADPCALGNELAELGVDFTAHVVGFDLSDAEGKQVACLAENTGGQYVSAANADELHAALLKTVVTPVEKAKVEQEAFVLPEASVDPDESSAIGETIAVNWTGPNASNDYIDIVPAEYKKTHGELAYTYTKEGTPLQIRAPGTPGTYQVRYIWRGTDNQRHVLATAPIQITDSDVALVAPDTVNAGAAVIVQWKGPANKGDYIDLVADGYTRTSGELSYAYAESKPEVSLRAPTKAGLYHIRYVLKAADGKRVLTQVDLNVSEAHATVSAPTTVGAGSLLSVFWTGPSGQGDYIDLVPADHKRVGGELSYFNTRDSKDDESGALRAPSKAGDYVVRYVLKGSGGARVIAEQPLSVTAAEASVSAPDQVEVGSYLTVEWTGPANNGDYVDLVPVDHKRVGGELSYFNTKGLEDGEAGTLRAPTKAGDYVVRYVLKGSGASRVIAEQPLSVTAASASVSTPSQAEAGAHLMVEWTGPANNGDYVDLVPVDHKRVGGELSYFNTKGLEDGEAGTLRAPTKAGDYVVRYVLKGSGASRVIAEQPLSVTAASASVSAPSQVKAEEMIVVEWSGPARQGDYVDLVPADHKRIGGELSYFNTKGREDGEAGTLRAPTKAGNYMVRYVLKGSGSSRVIASQPITVVID